MGFFFFFENVRTHISRTIETSHQEKIYHLPLDERLHNKTPAARTENGSPSFIFIIKNQLSSGKKIHM